MLANATASATRAILNGKSVSDAIGSSLASTALSEGISTAVDKINKNYELGAKLTKQIDAIKAEAQKYFNDNKIADLEATAKSNYDLATVNKTTYDSLKAKFDVAHDNYLKDKSQANADTVNNLATQVDTAATKTNDYITKFQDAQKKLEPLASYYTAHYVDPTNKIIDQMDVVATDNKKLAETLASDVKKYEGQITTDSTGLAKDLYNKDVVAKAVEAYKKADPNYTDEDEIKAFFNKQFGRDPTNAEKVQYMGVKTDFNTLADAAKSEATAKGITLDDKTLAKVVAEGGTTADVVNKIDNYATVKAADQKQISDQVTAFTQKTMQQLEAEGYSQADIKTLIDNGTIGKYVKEWKDATAKDIDTLKSNAASAAEIYGSDSKEAITARRAAVDAMATAGGYGITKDAKGNYSSIDSGVLDPNTLIPASKDKTWTDPVTGVLHVDISGVGQKYAKAGELDLNSLLSIGQSARPPEKGGTSAFGGGSGSTQSIYNQLGMPQLVAVDDRSGVWALDSQGYAVVTYADGHGAAIDKKTNEPIWLSAEDIKKLKGELDTASQGKINQAVTSSAVATGDIQKAIDAGAITKEEAKTLLTATGYKPTSDTEANQFAGMMTEEQAKAKINEYINPLMVTADEARQALIDAGVKNPTQEDVNNLMGQYAQTELKGKATTAAPVAQVNSQLASIRDQYNTLSANQKAQADALMAQGKSLNEAIFAAQSNLGTQISDVKTDVSNLFGTVTNNYNSLSSGQKKIADDLIAQGKSLSDAIQGAKDASAASDKEILDKIAANKAAADAQAAAAKAAAERQGKVSAIQMGVASLLPQIQNTMMAAQQPRTAPVPQEVVKITDPFSFESPLNYGYFGGQRRVDNVYKNTQNQDGTVKIASGGSIGLPGLLRRRG